MAKWLKMGLPMMRVLLAAVLLLPLLFSGCVSCEAGPPVTARDINNGDAKGGVGGYDLDVLITDGPGGAPLPQSGVVVYWESQSSSEWTSPSVTASDEVVIVAPNTEADTVEPTQTIRMRADDSGKTYAHTPTERIIGVVAAKDGFTEEWVAAIASGPNGGYDVLTIPLYRQYLESTTNNSWGPGAVSSGFITDSQYAWQPADAEFGESIAAKRGYAARLVEITVTITWENGPNGVGDLGIGIGPDPGADPTFFHDNDQNVAAGIQTESVRLTVQDLVDHNIIGDFPIQIGAATQSGQLAPQGLAYTLQLEARFDSARAELARCQGGTNENDSDGVGVSVPSIGLPTLLGALLVLGVVVRRQTR
jgi:hypothetical protein